MKRTGLFLALAMLANGAHAESDAELKRQLEQALKTINDLQSRVKVLEQKQSNIQEYAVRPTGFEAGPVVAPNAQAEKGVTGGDKARVEISGQVMFDAIYDTNTVDPDWSATLRPSKIPVYCPDNGLPRDAGCGRDGETVLSVKQSKIAFKGFIPTEYGELKTEFDMDLFDTGGSGSAHSRVLNAWGELGQFGAGQYYTLFMDIDVFPNTIDYWGPSGMVFIRNPQLRYTPYDKDGLKFAVSLESPGSAIDTGKIQLIDPALGDSISSRTEVPDFIANVRYDADWGHVQLAGMARRLSWQARSNPNSDPSGHKDGYGGNLSGVLKTWGDDRVVAQFAMGNGIAGYMNDGGADIAPSGSLTDPHAEAVQSIGWLVYYDHYWTPKWSSSIGYSEHKQDNTSGQLFNAFESGKYASLNVLYYPVKNMTTGVELMWGERENKDGNTGEDTRAQFSSKFTF